MKFLGRYADLSPESELSAIGKGRRDVGIDTRRIDLAQKPSYYCVVVSYYCLAVA